MDPASCRVIYIDDRFPAEKWLTRDVVSSPTTNNKAKEALALELAELPPELQANVNAVLGVFNQVFVCNSGRSFSAKLAELQESVKVDCTPILALFDVDSDLKHDHLLRLVGQKSHNLSPDSPTSARVALQRQLTFSSEADESYGLQLLSRITSDLQVDEGVKLVIPVALVRTRRKDSNATPATPTRHSYSGKDPRVLLNIEDKPSPVDTPMMLHCLDAGALDVVPSPLNNEKIMGLTVHAYRIYKTAKKEQSAFLASASQFMAAARRRKQSWVGIEEEKPYAYLREAMVKKLLKGICEPETIIEDYQHRHLRVDDDRKQDIVTEIGKWSFCAHDFSEDELVYAGYYMLDHALKMPELEHWRMTEDEILRFMQASRVAYNSFVLYHNFRHAIDVLQSVFHFLIQIGTITPYPVGSTPPPLSQDKSPVGQLLAPFEALTLLISAIGHDVGHPGVNNMFLVKLNAPLAQLYNDQSVLEAFHCAAYSQILRRHWPTAFADRSLRKLLISSILATDMGVHPDYMQRLGNLQEKIHESKTTDRWAPKDIETSRTLICGLLIKCADISNVARPWRVAERWTHLLQQEFASQGEMENQVGMETTLFGGPPEIGNMMKLANGQIGFMSIFAHPLFANVTDVIPAMGFAAAEINNNKSVWITQIEQEKRRQYLTNEGGTSDGGISPRSQSPASRKMDKIQTTNTGYFPASPLRLASNPPSPLQQQVKDSQDSSIATMSRVMTTEDASRNNTEAPSWKSPFVENGTLATSSATSVPQEGTRASSGVFPNVKPQLQLGRPEMQPRRSSNTVPRSLQMNGISGPHDGSATTTTASSEQGDDEGEKESELRKNTFTGALVLEDSAPNLPNRQASLQNKSAKPTKFANQDEIEPVSRDCAVDNRSIPQASHQVRTSGHMSVPSTTDSNSMATSGGQTYSTNPSTTLSPSTEATSFLCIESGDEQVEDRGSKSWNLPTSREQDHDRARSSRSILPEVVPPNPMGRVPPAVSSGRGRTKSPAKTSTATVKEPAQETVSSWEEDGDRSMRRRIGRFRFWRKKTEEDECQ